MQGFNTSALVGGHDGIIFNDIYVMGSDGSFIVNDSNKNQLDKSHPIQQISVSSGWVVDGISVTYQLTNASTSTLNHGSQFNQGAKVVFAANEILLAVTGRAGYQSYYKRDMIKSISFVIFDTVTGATRTVGPFGNSDGSNEGKIFHSADVLAFGGFAGSTDQVGLSGLCFFSQ